MLRLAISVVALALPAAALAEETDIVVRSNGVDLAATLNIPEEAGRPSVVLMLHGFTGQRDEFPNPEGTALFAHAADALARSGIASLRIDFTGSGESGGEWTETTFSGQVRDAVAAFDHLQALDGVDGSRVGILGYSQGGLVGAHLAALRPEAGAVVLWAPVTNPLRTYAGLLGADAVEAALLADPGEPVTADLSWGGQTTLNASFFHELATTSPAGAIARYSGPLEVVVGLKETIVTPQPAAGQILLDYHEGEEALVTVDSDHDWGWGVSTAVVDAELLPPTVGWFVDHLAP